MSAQQKTVSVAKVAALCGVNRNTVATCSLCGVNGPAALGNLSRSGGCSLSEKDGRRIL